MGIESIKHETKEGAMALFLEHITSLSDAELKAQLLVTKGAVHAVRNLLGREVTIENVEHMLDSLLEQEQMIDDLITKQPLPSPPNDLREIKFRACNKIGGILQKKII